MEKMNGHNQKDLERGFRKTFMGNRNLVACLVVVCLISGCGSLKKAAIVGSAAGLGATAGSVISGGVIAPIAASTMSASVASVVADQVVKQPTPTQPLEVTGDATIIQEAPSNFFSLLQQLVEMGGWLLILVILVPMVLGWILPGPLEKRKKKK